jgi:GAF domain-containing protein
MTRTGVIVTGPQQPDQTLIELAGILVSEQSLEETLSQVLALACGALARCDGDGGGVTLLEREGPATAVATSEAVRRADGFQYASPSGGPCLDAYRHQQTFRIDSTEEDRRWPEFCREAAAAGIKSTLSLPLIVAGDGLGAINIYCQEVNGFSAADEASGTTFAAHASVALANARMYWRTQRLADQLEEALSTRGVIEQAKGILIADQGCSDDEAFQLLVGASQRGHLKLREVAVELVEKARKRAAYGRGPAERAQQ